MDLNIHSIIYQIDVWFDSAIYFLYDRLMGYDGDADIARVAAGIRFMDKRVAAVHNIPKTANYPAPEFDFGVARPQPKDMKPGVVYRINPPQS